MTVLFSGEWSGAPPLEPVKPSRINVAMGWRASYAAGGGGGGFGGLGGRKHDRNWDCCAKANVGNGTVAMIRVFSMVMLPDAAGLARQCKPARPSRMA